MKALVYVTLKPDVLDPQGEAIRKACESLGHRGVRGVRQGKLFELDLEAGSEAEARELAGKLAEQLLANPVIEDVSVESIQP